MIIADKKITCLTSKGVLKSGVVTASTSVTDFEKFKSEDYIPVPEISEVSNRISASSNYGGAIYKVDVKTAGSGYSTGDIFKIIGDGDNAQVRVTTVNSGGGITGLRVINPGSGYTYGSVDLTAGGVPTGTEIPTFDVIIPPEGGHGADLAAEFFAKRVMTNIRLTYAEGSGDFPVDNDFRRIGIIQDPFNYGTTTVASASTLRGTAALKLTGSGDFTIDEEITQTVSGGTAKGRVVSWDSTNGILKYFQSPDLHTHNGKVLAFDHATNNVTGATSSTARPIDANQDTALADISFTDGKANPEIAPNSGDIVYIENRRQITRAADQIEDIKLVIEF